MVRDCCILQRKKIMTLVYTSVSKTNLNYRTQITTYFAVVSCISDDRWHYSWRWPSDRLLSVPESDLFHGEKRSVRKLWKHVGIVLPRLGASCCVCVGDGKYRLRSMMSSNRSNENNPSTIMNTKEKEKYIEEFDFPYCDEATKYEKVAKIGQGTFG